MEASPIMFRRISLSLLLMLTASLSMAQMRSRPAAPPTTEKMDVSARTVSGTVSSIQGSLVSIAGGLITIDASNAKITGMHDGEVTVSAITPGSLIFAVLTTADVAANAPLPAAVIGVTQLADATLTGPVSSVDVAGSTLTLLGRRIRVTAQTVFAGPLIGGPTRGLADLQLNQIVLVEANASGGTLVASNIRVMAPLPMPSTIIHGTVKSISTESWVITNSKDKADITVAVNAQTKIAGSPIVGDAVDVVATVDSAHAYVAISIVKSPAPSPLPDLTKIEGRVKSIGAASWVLFDDHSNEVTVLIDAHTMIMGSPKVGDQVAVLASSNGSNPAVAISIVTLFSGPTGNQVKVPSDRQVDRDHHLGPGSNRRLDDDGHGLERNLDHRLAEGGRSRRRHPAAGVCRLERRDHHQSESVIPRRPDMAAVAMSRRAG
jgi:hypothetical protein